MDPSPPPQVVDELRAWIPRFRAGQLSPFGFRQPRFEPGERFAVRITGVGASGSGEQTLRGAAYATDRRLFLVQNRRAAVREWRWVEHDGVRLARGSDGVLIGPDPADVVASLFAPKPDRAVQWLKVLAADACAHDRLDDWLAALSG